MSEGTQIQPFHIVEIGRPEDPLLPEWLALYETAFPAPERVLAADILRVLQRKARGEAAEHHFLAAVDAEGRLLALAWFHSAHRGGAACLWYLAVSPEVRGGGIGGRVYREVVRRLHEDGAAMMLFEVEIPELAASSGERRFAERRIAFYRRQGARVLSGIHYMQSVGPHQPPLPMHLMVHLLQPCQPEGVFQAARDEFGDALQQVGPLRLD